MRDRFHRIPSTGDQPYTLIRSRRRRRTIALRITPDGRILISAPCSLGRKEIEDFYRTKKGWVQKKLQERQGAGDRLKPKEFRAGETFLYLGNLCPLDLADERGGEAVLSFLQGKFVLRREGFEHARELFVRWYRQEAAEAIGARVQHFSRQIGHHPQGVRITGARTRWGSCSAQNRLCFSWRVMMAPPQVIDYVVLHELMHIREKNHSKRFWNRLEQLSPDYRACRRWLKEHGRALNF